MGKIHELFVLALSLVWFAGATPETHKLSSLIRTSNEFGYKSIRFTYVRTREEGLGHIPNEQCQQERRIRRKTKTDTSLQHIAQLSPMSPLGGPKKKPTAYSP